MIYFPKPALVLTSLLVLMSAACTTKDSQAQLQPKSPPKAEAKVHVPAEFAPFWSDGKAEISAYKGTQLRYNEVRPCTSVLIFVTEPFHAEKQVKADAPEGGTSPYTSVLKLNHTKRFQTGIYTYSLMTSVFTPFQPAVVQGTEYSPAAPLKITFSAQEWCGMVFHQLNRLQDKTMRSQSKSYFEREGDRDETLKADEKTLFGDDAFIAVRELLKPLPAGTVTFYHTLEHARIMHKPLASEEISIAKKDAIMRFRGTNAEVMEWTLTGKEFVWMFTVEKQYPRRILSYQFSEGGQVVEKAALQESMRLPYWKLNANGDESYLQELGISSK